MLTVSSISRRRFSLTILADLVHYMYCNFSLTSDKFTDISGHVVCLRNAELRTVVARIAARLTKAY